MKTAKSHLSAPGANHLRDRQIVNQVKLLGGPIFIFFLLLGMTAGLIIPAHGAQIDVAGPAGSAAFGTNLVVLPNGNFVVADTAYTDPANPGVTGIGAVYLYDGATLTIISTLKGGSLNDNIGSTGITVLTNGNFVVRSANWDNPSPAATNAGAVTWCSAVTGCNGTVNAANSLVGGTANDQVGNTVTTLSNGNYVISAQNWDNPVGPVTNVGAVTWGNGSTGISGLITPANSLIGGTSGDAIGGNGITVLTNGNYVVKSPIWTNPAGPVASAGAATWGNGTIGVTGLVSAANSLTGGRTNDQVGGTVTALTNGNYVVSATVWDNPSGPVADVGAVTWGNGATGTTGLVSPAISLVGGTTGDNVGGGGITVLTNGNYVVRSTIWTNPSGPATVAGAVTWGNGATGTAGPVSSANSLVGGSASDQIGGTGVTALTNGNYVVASAFWDNPVGPVTNAGAATWGNGAGGTTGLVAPANSLVGGRASDQVGTGGVTALINGNYVVKSQSWDNPSPVVADVGAVTWGNGTTGISGLVTAANSMVGSTASDSVGNIAVVALTNGNYVVGSPLWDNPAGPIVNAGAVTWANGATGMTGPVTAANSLVGTTANDVIGGQPVTPLTNGNYVVHSTGWTNTVGPLTGAGAATWGNGLGGTTGPITAANSLIGGTANDQVGAFVNALPNGNYVVSSSNWDSPGPVTNVGSVVWGNGATGTSGAISSSNALVGGTVSDQIGSSGVTVLNNGNYVVNSTVWDNPAGPIANARAVTLGSGTGGTVGAISSANSILGTVANGVSTFSYDTARNRLFAGRGPSNIVSILVFNTNAIADGNIDNPANWDAGVPNSLVNATIPAGRAITVNTDTTAGSLVLAPGASLAMNANLTLTGNLSLGAPVNTGNGVLGLSCSSAITGASASNYLIGSLRKGYCAPGSFDFPVGTAGGYAPVTVNATAGNFPGDFLVKANAGTMAGAEPRQSLTRNWTLTPNGISQADITLNYNDTDVPAGADETQFKFVRHSGPVITEFAASSSDIVANSFTLTGLTAFSDWTLGKKASPTAAGVTVAGRVLTVDGHGLSNAVVQLTDMNGRTSSYVTSAFGYYEFDQVEAGQTYVVSVNSKRFVFAPQFVFVTEVVPELDFVAAQ